MGSIVYINSEPVYAWVAAVEGSVRLRVASGEWRTLELDCGSTVTLEAPGQVRRLLVSSVVPMPDTGLTWIELVPPIFVDRGRLPASAVTNRHFDQNPAKISG